ncbi:MAG: hypothetical protein HY680_02480 [Chloroflexi bacterium]|nr:hypothetical protein [Chloroflexota bacterium]
MTSASQGRPPWLAAINSALDSLKERVRVLVWGPGETSQKEWWEKRRLLVEALTENNQQDEVYTSEDIIRETGTRGLEAGDVELVHAQTADIVIALVLATPDRQGGVYRELQVLAPYEELRDKVVIFLPDVEKYVATFHTGMLQRYSEAQKLRLDWGDFNTCHKVRTVSVAKVEEVRNRRAYQKLDAYLRSGGHPSL